MGDTASQKPGFRPSSRQLVRRQGEAACFVRLGCRLLPKLAWYRNSIHRASVEIVRNCTPYSLRDQMNPRKAEDVDMRSMRPGRLEKIGEETDSQQSK